MTRQEYIDTKAQQAVDLFKQGANCSQAVAAAFAEECGMPQATMLRLASGFGGGFARLREVCGAVSGMVLVANLLNGPDDLTDKKAKDDHYAFVQRLAKAFQTAHGSLVCRDLLGLKPNENNAPESTARTSDFYKKRPCAELVHKAAEILAEALA